MLLVAVIPETASTAPLLHGLITNAGISGVALLITAIIQTSKHSLSLYHAIFIIHILYFTGILVAPSGKHAKFTVLQGLTAIIVDTSERQLQREHSVTPSACNNGFRYDIWMRIVVYRLCVLHMGQSADIWVKSRVQQPDQVHLFLQIHFCDHWMAEETMDGWLGNHARIADPCSLGLVLVHVFLRGRWRRLWGKSTGNVKQIIKVFVSFPSCREISF